jgi:hypothetical protein
VDMIRLRSYEAQVVRGVQRPRKRYAGRDVLEWMVPARELRPGYQGAVLLFEFPPEIGDGHLDPMSLTLVAVGRLEALKKGSRTDFRALHANDWSLVTRPLSLGAILQTLDPSERERLLSAAAHDQPRPLDKSLSERVLGNLARLVPEDGALIRAKETPPRRRLRARDEEEVIASERSDRAVSGLRYADVSLAAQTVVKSEGTPSQEFRRFDKKLREHDMATQDASVFPGWQMSRSIGGWFEFLNGGRRVLMKNIDFSSQETDTGGDLVYIRRNPDTALVVQYKRLHRPTSRTPGWTFRNDGRIYRQLDKMLEVDCSLARTSFALGGSDEYRLNEQIGFVKFVDARPLKSTGMEPLDGCYLPAQYGRDVLRELEDPDGKWKRAFNPRAVRNIDSRTFVQLVKEGWIGSCAEGTEAISAKLLPMLRDERSGEVTCVFDEPI